MQNNKIAVIGSSSFIGRNIIKSLKTHYHLTGFGRKPNSDCKVNVVFEYPDSPLDLEILLAFDSIVYCAASGVQSNDKQDDVFPLNLFLPIQIATFLSAREYKGKFFTFGSYFEIGNNANFVSFDEDAVSNSKERLPNNYCVSKRILSSFYRDSLVQIKFYHFILPTIYGKGESEHRLIPYLLKNVETGMPISVTSGNQVRQYLHIKDFVALFREILSASVLPSGIYNFPSQTTISVKEIVSRICLMYGISSNNVHTSDGRYDETMLYLALKSSKIQNLFPNWKPQYSLEKGILDYGLPINFKINHKLS